MCEKYWENIVYEHESIVDKIGSRTSRYSRVNRGHFARISARIRKKNDGEREGGGSWNERRSIMLQFRSRITWNERKDRFCLIWSSRLHRHACYTFRLLACPRVPLFVRYRVSRFICIRIMMDTIIDSKRKLTFYYFEMVLKKIRYW